MSYITATVYLGKLTPEEIAAKETALSLEEGITTKADKVLPEMAEGSNTGKFYAWVYITCTQEVWNNLANKKQQQALF